MRANRQGKEQGNEPARMRVLALAHLRAPEVAAHLGLSIRTVYVYMSQLRRAGHSVPGNATSDHADWQNMVRLPAAVAQELQAQAKARGRCGKSALIEHIIMTIHRDDLYDAILGPPRRRRR